MLVPAIKYKDQLNKQFEDLLYSEDMYCFCGYNRSTPYTVPDTSNDRMYPIFEYAIVPDEDRYVVFGYVKYCIDISTDTVSILGVISFANPDDLTVAKDTYKLFNDLIDNHRRVEWKAVEGCKAIPAYIKLCEKYKGMYVRHYDVYKDCNDNFRDAYDFEILKYTSGRKRKEK